MTDPQKTIVVTGVGVVSPYEIGLARLQRGMLAGQSCLERRKDDVYPGFAGTTAAVRELPPLAKEFGSRYSRTDQLAVIAAQDAITNSGCDSNRSSGCDYEFRLR